MKAGTVKISPELLMGHNEFSKHWKLESIHMNPGDRWAVAVISGYDFPEIPENGIPKECQIVCHVERINYEVKEIKPI